MARVHECDLTQLSQMLVELFSFFLFFLFLGFNAELQEPGLVEAPPPPPPSQLARPAARCSSSCWQRAPTKVTSAGADERARSVSVAGLQKIGEVSSS